MDFYLQKIYNQRKRARKKGSEDVVMLLGDRMLNSGGFTGITPAN